MLSDARFSPKGSARFGMLLSLVLAVLVLSTLLASPEGAPVLVIVPPDAELAAVEKTRATVTAQRKSLLVAESDRVRVKGGFEMLVDRSFANAPAADVLVLVAGEPGRAEETFLLERRRSAKAILLPPGSAIAEKIRGQAPGGALILVGGIDSIAVVLDAVGVAASPAAPPSPVPTFSAPPARTATPPTAPAASRVFDRYFSSPRPSPSPTPR